MLKFDFHISRNAREKYELDNSLFSITGNIVIADFQQARLLSEKINKRREKDGIFDQYVTAGEINALGLLHEIYHFLIRKYDEEDNPGVFKKGIKFLADNLNQVELQKVFLSFTEEFPPREVYQGKLKAGEYLNGKTGGKENKEIILEELILLHIENINPATAKLRELYSDDSLIKNTSYSKLIRESEKFFDQEEPPGIGGLHLFSLLRKPISTNPYDIQAQLDYIRDEWGVILGNDFLLRLLKSVDLIKEDYKLFVKHGGGEKGTPPVPSYDSELARLRKIKSGDDYELSLEEVEKFTEDTDWIPEVVMLAKNVHVWLHQLSEKYNRDIKTLNEIPDEELDRIASWNFTALWLIGIWERSTASKKIKKLTGNPEAAASAYSLYDYVIANDLGGEEAFRNLKNRAWLRGIRMASDMVPNHSGIYSKWVIEKPDYFLQTNTLPFPNYSFNGPNLSEDGRVEVRIEDKYFDRSDAAVVFERKDSYTGNVKYIYHGNDGTNMPWNDTAQLNLLNPEVRESIIQTIMHVAHKTPIIRFDAAMTLSKKHYQRLWFPQPGTGGAIPSRSDYAMTKQQFDSLMPVEFWREVVDRINESMPNVLLLAEAFWLMEGYFVRTLGMHRVYNSAFMHMMMKEENEKYKQLIKNTLEFNPEILKRYVNFMSNPDEETAINQFGKGDKYFGVAVMMVTMPGLPMFGHGQIEGFSEKYGMEYTRAYYDETADEHLVWRHQKELFPLMSMRHIFSQVDNFQFYDFIEENGYVNHNVFAFSNKYDNEQALVLYNNSYIQTKGSIKYSCHKVENGNTGNITKPRKISDLFSIKPLLSYFYIYKDHRTQLHYLLSGKDVSENGFQIHLFGYQYRICLKFKEVYDADGRYDMLFHHLNGRGVSSIDEAMKEMELIPLHSSIESMFSLDNLEKFRTYILLASNKTSKKNGTELPPRLGKGFRILFEETSKIVTQQQEIKKSEKKFTSAINSLQHFYGIWIKYNNRKNIAKWMSAVNDVLPVTKDLSTDSNLVLLFSLCTFEQIFSAVGLKAKEISKRFDEMMIFKPLGNVLDSMNNSSNIHSQTEILRILLIAHLLVKSEIKNNFNQILLHNGKKKSKDNSASMIKILLSALLEESFVHNFLHVNEYNEIIYFSKERLEQLLNWLLLITILEYSSRLKKGTNKEVRKLTKTDLEKNLLKFTKNNYEESATFLKEAESTGYDFTKFKNRFKVEVKKKKRKSNIKTK